MKEASGKHPQRCETCKNKNCDLSNDSLERVKATRILDVGRIMMMRCTTEIYGCASHSSAPNPAAAAEQRIKDVIAELERLAVLYHAKSEEYAETGDTALHERLWGEWLAITKAISLLRGGKP